jgi:hypothetical protein
MLQGIGYGMAGVGLLSNALGGDPMAGVNADLNRYSASVQGGKQWVPGAGATGSIWDKIKGRGSFQQTPGRAAPQAGPAQLAQTSGFRDNQQELISRLEALSKGQGPSLAAEQLRQATDRNMKQQASIAQSGRGNAALAGITASNASAGLGAQAASDSAVARIAEQQMALQQLGGAIGQGRGQDQDLSQFNALQQNYRDQFNIEAQLRARGLDDAAIQAILQMKQAAAANKQANSFGNQLMAGGAGLLSMTGTNAKGGGAPAGPTPAWNLPRY